MEYVEGEHRLVAVSEYPVIGLHVLSPQTEHKNNAAPACNAPNNLKEHVLQREGFVTRQWIVTQYQDELTESAKKNQPHSKANPSMPLETLGEALVRRHDVTY